MVAEPWLLRMGNQVSSNIKNSVMLQQKSSGGSKKKDECRKKTIGILSFEVANVMSKLVHLHKSVSDSEIWKLKNERIKEEGVKRLVSGNEGYLLELGYAERIDDLNTIAEVVSRLGKKCNEAALIGFEHVYGDIRSGKIEVKELGFLVKDMEGMIRKMERYVGSTANLYGELEVLNELEQATNKFQLNHNQESRRALEQKLSWQRQDVCHLRDISLWNQTYDKVVELLARTVCTLYDRICAAFGNTMNSKTATATGRQMSSNLDLHLFQRQHLLYPCAPSPIPGRIFMECLSLGSSASRVDDDDDDDDDPISILPYDPMKSRSRLAPHATPSTVGGSALALHYANLILVIEKLVHYPHLVGEEARHDLYQMLPCTLRRLLRTNLKSKSQNFAIFDGALAHDWKENLDQMFKWLAPLAHNMIKWQSERNFEQQQIVTRTRTNVLLLQTLYFADRDKTESAICDLLVGLNYICRYEHQQNALLDCASSFDFGDWMEWQLHCQASCFD